jgi:small conductance mechanosensitive channel
MPDLSIYTQEAVKLLMVYGPKLILAIVTLIIGLWVIKLFMKSIGKTMEPMEIDVSLQKFLVSLFGVLLKILLVISVVSMIGVQTTSFIAILGATALAVGLALQGSLANFAGGVLILLFKPFKVGDVIDAQGYLGTVNDIKILNTVLKTPDNKMVVIPNGTLSNNSITNFSTQPTRRVDMTFGIGYSDDLKKAKEILNNVVNSDSRVLKDPKPMVVVSELADSSVNFAVRVWCNNADYWGVFFDTQEKVKLEFDNQDISIPFPQRDVHIYNHKEFNGKQN